MKYGMMLTYFSQVLPKNVLWLWKYIREYYKKMNTFFTIYICWPCPWAWTPALSHEFLQFKWRGPWTSDDAFSLFSPSCGCREEDFLIWNTFLLFGHFGPTQGPEPQETWILQFWRRGSWTSYNKMYRCILWLSLTQLWSWEEDFYI